MNIGVIGAGAWGTALALLVARGGHDVTMWSYDGSYKQFWGVEMPAAIKVTRQMSELSSCDAWLVVTPSAFFRETMRIARAHYNGAPVIICTKGAEYDTGCFMSEILTTEIPQCTEFGVLSGPQFAGEVASRVPTGSTLAGGALARRVGMAALNQMYLEETDDVTGVELCGVGKNAVALICGYNSVAAAGENQRALIFTRAWGEVVNLGLKMGAKTETFLALCGIGDLFLSATSETSRNFSGGMAIARDVAPDGTVEGIFALRGLIARASKMGVATPVLCEMREKMGI